MRFIQDHSDTDFGQVIDELYDSYAHFGQLNYNL